MLHATRQWANFADPAEISNVFCRFADFNIVTVVTVSDGPGLPGIGGLDFA
jgi:hypothetical protein